MELENKRINFLGDSITFGTGTSEERFIYHQVLKRKADLAEARNYGIGGTRIARQSTPSEKEKHDLDFCSRVEQMDDDADIIVVFGGTNDYGHGDAPMGSFSDRTEHSFYGACHVLMEKLICKYPGKPIVFMTPLHRCGEMKAMANGVPKNLTLRDYVHALKEVAEYYSIPVLDLYAVSGIQPNIPALREMFCPDGLHPNDAGNAVIADKLEKFLRAL